jgi:nitroreductase
MTPVLEELLSRRRSLRSFAEAPIKPEILDSLFDAARWASSAFNEQPWHYVVLDAAHPEMRQRVLDCMEPHNRAWAEKAPVILVSVAQVGFRSRDGLNRHAFHDVGQANAHLALRAAEHGLTVHLIGGFDPSATAEVLGLQPGFEAVALLTVAHPGQPEALPEALRVREVAPRSRRDISQFVHRGGWR